MAKGLVWAMEELMENDKEAVVEAPVVSDSLETDMLDINERAVEIDDHVASMEEVVEDIETLEDIAGVMEESTENGGMDQAGARVAEIAVESLYKRLNVNKKKPLPAMESFGSKGTRITATKIAVEGIKEVLSAAWEHIKAAVGKVWGWITNFFTSIAGTAKKLKERATELIAKLKPLTDKPAESTVNVGNLAIELSTGGKTDVKALVNGLDNLTEVVKGGDASITSMAKDMTDSDLVKASASDEELAQLEGNEVVLAGFVEVDDGKEDEDGMVTFTTKELPGGNGIVAKMPGKGKKGKAAAVCKAKQKVSKDKYANMRKRGIATESQDDNVVDVEAKEVPTVPSSELSVICEKVVALSTVLESSGSILSKIKSAANSFMNMIKSAVGKITEGSKDAGSAVQKAISGISSSVSSYISSVYNSAIGFCKKFLDYVEKHIAAWKAPKSESKELAVA